nr:ceramidase domain-containing protein [Methylomarinum sp. Ch1-1]MDP4519533.1 ceramidase domain-containing protein [Methylomarinum sp. Ch1-1]
MNNRFIVAMLGALVIIFVAMMLVTEPLPQNSAYHQLADQRAWLMVPNFLDIVSNLPFALVGIAGLCLCLANKTSSTALSWPVFFVGLFLTAIGSSYYHWFPNNQRLVWDRLPMTLCFTSLFVAMLTENASVHHEKAWLPIALLLGLASVLYWRYSGDLRFYAFIQFGVLASIPVILLRYKSRYSHRHYLLYGLLWYGLAKLFELNDQRIFSLTDQLISGHTLKHLSAGAATFCVYRMLKNRRRLYRQ